MEEVIRTVKKEIEREQRQLCYDESHLKEQRDHYQNALTNVDQRKARVIALEAGLKKLEGGE